MNFGRVVPAAGSRRPELVRRVVSRLRLGSAWVVRFRLSGEVASWACSVCGCPSRSTRQRRASQREPAAPTCWPRRKTRLGQRPNAVQQGSAAARTPQLCHPVPPHNSSRLPPPSILRATTAASSSGSLRRAKGARRQHCFMNNVDCIKYDGRCWRTTSSGVLNRHGDELPIVRVSCTRADVGRPPRIARRVAASSSGSMPFNSGYQATVRRPS